MELLGSGFCKPTGLRKFVGPSLFNLVHYFLQDCAVGFMIRLTYFSMHGIVRNNFLLLILGI